MPKTNKVSQKKWVKGVNAAATRYAQPPGSFPRSSNLLMTKRGGLITCDGTQLISAFNGIIQPLSANFGPITETFLFMPTGLASAYYGIYKDFNSHLGAPSSLVAADGGGGGNLSAGTYQWQVTALDGAGGETNGSNNQSLVLAANHKGSLTWTAVTFATGYNVYRTVAGGTTKFLVNTTGPVTTNSYTDNIADINLGTQVLPTVDTTQVSQFVKLVTPSYNVTNIVKEFPADLPPLLDGTGGGFGGGGGPNPISGQKPPQPTGGIAGNISPLPQIVQFTDKMILALGNGFAPYQSDGTGGGTIALVNNFTASYPARANSNPQVIGDLMTLASVLYKASQGGTTASVAPAFNTTKGATTADGSVIWVSQGNISSVPAPRGAAHAIVYAGSLWIFNTSPTTTADDFDGPSCLKMSDLNNPNSWNPLNIAFLEKDDGTQGMGLATFTIAEAGIPPTGSLIAFKSFSTFQINGVFGSSSFSIQRAQTDLGCMAPRSIQFVPGFGIMRLAHLGIAVFDGVRDRLISEEIRPYLFGGQTDIQPADWNFIWASKGSQVANPPMYVCAIPTYIAAGSLTGPVVAAVATNTAGPNLAGQGANAGFGGQLWVNPNNITSLVSYATQAASGHTFQDGLAATHFGFGIGFTPPGITVTFEAFSSTVGASVTVSLFKNGVLAGTPKRIFLTTSNAVYTAGNASDLWGTTWTSGDINNVNFGFVIQVNTLSNGTNPDCSVRNGNISIGSAITIPNGSYFFQVVKYDVNGIRTVTTEQGPFTLGPGSGNGYQVTVPAPNPGDLKYRVYFGIGTGGENQFSEFPATQLTFTSSVPGSPTAGFATSSNGELTRLLCYDLVLKGWIIVDLPFSIFTLKQYRSQGTIPITTMSGYYDGAFRRWQAGDKTWDAGSLNPIISWKVRTPEVFGRDASDRVYFRQLVINGQGNPGGMQAQTNIDGISQNQLSTKNVTVTPMGGNQFIAYAEIGLTGVDAHSDINGTGQIEIDSVDWLAVVKAIRGRITV
jgi:hypothetical protein